MQIKVKIEGLNELKANLRRYPQISAPEIEKAIKKSVNEIEKNAKPRTPVDTGRLRGSYRTNFGKFRGEIGPNTNYALYVHEGTRKMKARPYLRQGVDASKTNIDTHFKTALKNIVDKISKI